VPPDPLFDPNDGGTPLDLDECEGLRLTHITLRGELNEAEQQNIADATLWATSRNRNPLDVAFLRTLHRRMFGDVWAWAGEYRQTGKTIGIDPWKIPTELYALVDNVQFWTENATFEPDKIAALYHHGLVLIHPFPNGNGRWSRLATDLLIRKFNRPPLTWGRGNLTTPGALRRRYIDALRHADRHHFGPLIEFMRS